MTAANKPIYIAGYPKSGTTYLTWLLADALNSPSGGSIPKEDKKEIATDGENRRGPYVVRKGHFVLVDGESSEFVPAAHKMARERFGEAPVIFIVRDPRDILVSAKHYFYGGRKTVIDILTYMVVGNGPFRSVGPYHTYIRDWYDTGAYAVKYEHLIKDPYSELRKIIDFFRLVSRTELGIIDAIHRQSFQNRRNIIAKMDSGEKKNIADRLVRRGKPGGWREELTRSDKMSVAEFLNPTIIKLGYEQDHLWWKK